jgi:GT2 family glycosyltransferase
MDIGIGVVSYKRPKECTKVCQGILETINQTEHNFQLVCSLDQEDTTGYEWVMKNFKLISGKNKGVASNKNKALKRLQNNDIIFLFEDDLVPKKKGWIDLYLKAIDETGMHHFNHSSLIHRDKLLKIVRSRSFILCLYEKNAAQLMVMTRKVIDEVGAFDERYGKFGFEHSDYTRRCKTAGLCNPPHHDMHPFILESCLYFEELNIPRTLSPNEIETHTNEAHKIYMDFDPKRIYIPFPEGE